MPMPATPMRPSTAGADPSLEHTGQPVPAGSRETEGPDSPAVDQGGNAGNGNNTRSFRFLLTLALRKAQTAVTLDNGGHVDEAIRTYREAISMLGLVLNRTNEEDGRQRLLHFRQTYSDRVSVLSSLRPPVAGQPEADLGEAHIQPNDESSAHQGLESQGPSDAHHYHTTTASTHPLAAATHIQGSDAEEPAAARMPGNDQRTGADNGAWHQTSHVKSTDQLPSSAEISPIPIPNHSSAAANTDALVTSPLATNDAMLTVELLPALGLGPDEQTNSSVDTNKPLPPVLADNSTISNMRKYSIASNGSVGSTSHMSQFTADNASILSNAQQSGNINSHDGLDYAQSTDAAEDDMNADDTAPVGDRADKSNRKGKSSDKANRRQSIKSQRSLPAMFGIGLKPKSDNKAAPPVPPLPIGESNAPKFGRRLLGALRSTQNVDPQLGRQSASRGNSEDNSQPTMATAQGTHQPEQQPTGSFSLDRTSATAAADLDEAESELPVVAKRAPELCDIPPPTPAKDSPPTPAKLPSQTLTREQKRQSNAAHRLAGLFKRKPSVPDIPSPALPAKYSADNSRAAGAMAQSPPPTFMLPKDRRLSASASTPNLFEAAAVAASNDQPSMAVYAATERGVLPPMPAPPTLRPSMSANSHPVGYTESLGRAEAHGERAAEPVMRTARGDSVSDAASTHSGISRLDDKLRRKQPQSARPTLMISTKSTADMLGFVPEDSPLPSAPLTAGADGASRSRKSSIATTNSQMFARGVGSMPYSAVPGLGVASQQLYGRPTLVDVEEDQRSDMFEPSFGTFHTDIGPPPPKSSPLSPLWFISTLHRSMVSNGAYLTSSMFIPRRMWFQTGIRITAIETKLGVLAQLTQPLVSINSLLALPDIDALLNSATPKQDEQRAETVPWESEENRGRGNQERDELHKSCVALHHWLNNLEDTLENSRRLLGKKLKFVNPSAGTGASAAPSNGASSQGPVTASAENLQASISHLPFMPAYMGPHDGSSIANASFPSLALSNADLPSSHGVPVSPLSPSGEPTESRLLEARVPDTPSSAMINGSMASSSTNLNRDMLSKDQMANARFKGLGKLGKSVDRIYSNIQKEKLDDTSAYVAALQRFFEAAMVLESIMHYFSRVAGDSEMAGWFTEVPQSPVSLAGKRNHTRGQGESGSISAASPSMPHTTLTSEPSMSSINSNSERKSSNASISLAATAADKKNRRRSNYFSQRQNSNGMLEGADPMPTNKLPNKARGESFSAIPRLVLAMPAGGALPGGSSGNTRFVLAPSPIKNPASFVHQGRGRAPGVIYARLVKLTEWLNQVILAWVVRDLQVLYAKYIKRLREWVIE